MHKIDSNGNVNGNWVAGNPETGQQPTAFTAEWLNAVQSEIINFLNFVGITPSKTENDQLTKAIKQYVNSKETTLNQVSINPLVEKYLEDNPLSLNAIQGDLNKLIEDYLQLRVVNTGDIYLVTRPTIEVLNSPVAGQNYRLRISGGKSSFQQDANVFIDHYLVTLPNDAVIKTSGEINYPVPLDSVQGSELKISAVAVDSSEYAYRSAAKILTRTVNLNHPPDISNIAYDFPVLVSAGQTGSMSIIGGTDPEGQVVLKKITNPVGVQFSVTENINSSTVVNWSIDSDRVDGSDITYNIIAFDENDIEAEAIFVSSKIQNNSPPDINKITHNFPNDVYAGDSVTFSFNIPNDTDADGDAVSVVLTSPIGLSLNKTEVTNDEEVIATLIGTLGINTEVSIRYYATDGKTTSLATNSIKRDIKAKKPDISNINVTFPDNVNIYETGTFRVSDVADPQDLPLTITASTLGDGTVLVSDGQAVTSLNVLQDTDVTYEVSGDHPNGDRSIEITVSNGYQSVVHTISTHVDVPHGTINPSDGETATIGPGVSSISFTGHGSGGEEGNGETINFSQNFSQYGRPGVTFNSFPEIDSKPYYEAPLGRRIYSISFTGDATSIALFREDNSGVDTAIILPPDPNFPWGNEDLSAVSYYTKASGSEHSRAATSMTTYFNYSLIYSAGKQPQVGYTAIVSGAVSKSFNGAAAGVPLTPPHETETFVLDPTKQHTFTFAIPVGTTISGQY